MVLLKFKSLKEARQAMQDGEIARSVREPHRFESQVEQGADFGRQESYEPGLYRFKSWQEARESDLQRLIRGCKKGEPS